MSGQQQPIRCSRTYPFRRICGSDGPDAPGRYDKVVTPSLLQPGESGNASWTLWHPITLSDKEYVLRIWVRTSNALSSYCEVNIRIPKLEAPVLAPECQLPDSLLMVESLDSYMPNPFEVTLTCTNRGGLPALGVTGFVYLPANTELADSTESLRKAFPSPMNEWRPGDTVPRVTWRVRYTSRPRIDEYPDFRFIVGGADDEQNPTDSVGTMCRMRVKGVRFFPRCLHIQMPDSLPVNQDGTDVTPNPFTIRYGLWNPSHQTGTIQRIDLNYPMGNGLSLDPATPKTHNVNRTLAPGDTLTVTWVMHVENRITRRYVQITAIAYDEEDNPMPCMRDMLIANVRATTDARIPHASRAFELRQHSESLRPEHEHSFRSATRRACPSRSVQ
ncbi:MAG: hypothetical protein IPP94_16545 [Ignavibacteria bacterium]|nr:hypothetical protein [Ignavibacteria bacterium]